MPQSQLFSPADLVDDDLSFRACRDYNSQRDCRAALEQAYLKHHHLLPEVAFLSEFRRNFRARAWELWVLDWLASKYEVEKSPPMGPDFSIIVDGKRIWIECVIATTGTGADRVLLPAPGQTYFSGLRAEQVALRYTNAIVDKHRDLARYRNERPPIVKPDEPVVIALHCGAIPYVYRAEQPDGAPVLVQALFGIGEPEFIVPINDPSSKIEVAIAQRPVLRKSNQAKVSSRGFLDGEVNAISAVAFVISDLGNWPSVDHLQIAHNHCAENPLTRGLLPSGPQWFVNGETLVSE